MFCHFLLAQLTQPAPKIYPPKSNQDLRTVWQKIASAAAPNYQKQALLYYLLKDCRQLTDIDSTFARKVFLPHKYQLLMMGLWELDHCQFSRALDHLTDPSLTPTFSDEILYILFAHPKCDNSLAMAYYLTVSPPLQSPRTLDAYFSFLCQTSVVEAYRFCRSHGYKHEELFEKLIVSVLSGSPGDARAENALTLIGLPFSEEEEKWFEECLLYGKGAKCREAKDSVMMRRIALGKNIEGVGALDRLRGHKINGVNWDDVRLSMQRTTATA